MKLTRKALALGFAVAAVSAVACSSQHGSTVGTAGGGGSEPVVLGSNGGNTGSVGMHLNIGTSGFTISSLNWTIANGSNSYQGTINMTDDAGNAAQSIEFVAGPVVAGGNYVVTLSGSDSNGDPCTGTSPPFTVNAGTSTTATAAVNVTCTVPTDAAVSQTVDSGTVAVDASVILVSQSAFQCPGITGVSISPAELHPPQIATISGGEAIPASPGGTPTFAWTATCDPVDGSVGVPIIGNAASPLTTFACGTAINTNCHLTLTVGLNGTGADGGAVGQVCTGVANTTITETIHCEVGGLVCAPCATGQTQCGTAPNCDCEPLNGGGTNHFCGTCGTTCGGTTPSCVAQGSTFVCSAPPPAPCVGVNDAANCVKCDGNATGICTPTEALLVQRDISKSLLSSGQETGSTGCYECLFNAGCIDDTVLGDSNHECGDAPGNVTAGAAAGETETQACLNTLNCVFPSGCQNAKVQNGAGATDGIDNCYCGANFLTASLCNGYSGGAVTASSPNGSCFETEVDGLGLANTATGSAVLGNFTTHAGGGSGYANAIFLCAGSNSASFKCPTCF
jgi:hypothetical protein